MIDIINLTKRFGSVTAVDSLTMSIADGEVFGFLGPNGAGKTTTMRMLCCLISKTSGEAKLDGYDIGKASEALAIRKMIGLLPENVGLHEELTSYQNLDYYGRLYDCPLEERRESIERWLRLLGLWERRDQPVGDFSKGMKQKLALARALVHDPRFLFLDEPTANLDPEAAVAVTELILQLKQQGKTVFLNTHNLDEAQKVCDRIGIVKTKLLAVNTPEQLRTATWGNRTIIQLRAVSEAVLMAVATVTGTRPTVEENRLTVDVSHPLEDNPKLVQVIVAAGGEVQYVTQLAPDLEETYLRVIRETA